MSLINSNGRLTIGLLSNSFDYEYQMLLWTGFENAAKELNVNTVCFAGGELNSPDLIRRARNTVYKIINKEYIDGLIYVPSTMGGFLSPEEIKKFYNKFENIPSVSIGMKLNNISSILIDNKNGIKDLVEHLIEAHGYKKFLYIGGPVHNVESQERLDSFKETLECHNISINPDLIKVADFRIAPSYGIVSKLLDQGIEFDCIVAANDDMAIGAIDALLEKKMIIPDQVAVTGFDDVNSARLLISPLTTVRQPLFEIARKAVVLLLKKIKGEKIPDLEIIKTELIIRRSCGCISKEIDQVRMSCLKLFCPDTSLDYSEIKTIIMDELKKDSSMVSIKSNLDLIESTIDKFFKVINNQITDEEFLSILSKSLRQSSIIYFEDSLWDRFLSFLRKKVLPYFLNQLEMIIKIEDLIHQSRILIKEMSKQSEMNIKTLFMERSKTIQKILRDLVNSFNIHILLEKMASELPRIGIYSCYLSLHPSNEKMFREARLLLAYNKSGRIKLGKNGVLFPAFQLFPREIIKLENRFSLIIESLVYEEEQLGFIVFEMNPLEGVLMTSISDQIKSTIKASMLIQETIERGKELEKALSELKFNHIHLEQTYEKLKENQEKLLLSEKMASLGRLTSGIAHEMNSPLAAVRASLSELSKLINEYQLSVHNTGITKEDHADIANDMIKCVALSDKAIETATSFLRSIKAQTREMSQKDRMIFNVVEIINESILLLSHALRRNNLAIEFNSSRDSIALFGLPGRMSQIITNLIANAIDALENKKGETIKIDLTENEKNVIISVEDKGCGIPEANLIKIFDPLFTTKPFGQGTGLGLTIVHDIVYGEFVGIIEVESMINAGTTFKLIFNKMEEINGAKI